MTPNETITKDAVRIMIYDAIAKIEEKRDAQHEANLRRFASVDSKLNRIIGGLLLLMAIIPILDHFLK